MGLTPSKRGWPDFIAWNRDGSVAFVVEVKRGPGYALRSTQIAVMNALSKHGIQCKRYDPVSGFSDFNAKVERRNRVNRSRTLRQFFRSPT